MKVRGDKFAGVAPRAAGECRIFFFCGQDEAGAAMAARKLVELLPDAGERVEIAGAELKADPARLLDEARSNSLFGGTRHIIVRTGGDEAHDAIKLFAEMADLGEAEGACPVLVLATSATDKSRTAKLLENRSDCLVAMFYQPDLSTVSAEVGRMAGAAGLKPTGTVTEAIARAAGLDLRIAESEIAKLALYLDASPLAPREVDQDALAAIGAQTDDDELGSLVQAVMSGQLQRIPGEIHRLREMSLNPVGVVLALERRAALLARLVPKLAPGADPFALAKAEGVFFREQRQVGEQLRRWSARKLERLVPGLVELHRTLLANSQNAELILAQALTRIALMAAPRR